MQIPKVSIIITNYNGKKFLDECFLSIETNEYVNYEIILIDNASCDGSVEYTKRRYPNIKIIENKENLGFALANNKAFLLADGKYLFFLNNDTKIHRNALSILVEKMESDNDIGIGGSKVLSYDGKVCFHTGIGIDIFGFPVNNGRVFYAEGSALMIKKELFELLGGFDEKYFMFHEDVDLAWRAWLSGYRVAAFSEAIVYHLLGASAGGTFPKKEKYRSTTFRRYYAERNNIRTLLKNYTVHYLILILPFYFLINVIEIILFLLILKPKVSFCYIKAYAWNIKNFKDTLLHRIRIQRNRRIPDTEIISKMYKGIGKFFIFKKVGIPRFEQNIIR